MYRIENGILYKDSKKIMALGVAYYSSFHPQKIMVPEDGNRYEEMKEDISRIKECGFNLVRTSALGELKMDDNGETFSAEFIDAMLNEIEKDDMCSLVRIQGYSMKSQDYPDAKMITNEGVAYDGKSWEDFINDSIAHKDVLNDNRRGTKAIADYFKNRESLVGYLTYNEPHYPGNGIYDYSKSTIEAYREWLRNNNIELSDDLDNYNPPTRRPIPGERLDDWIYWRMYAVEAMSKFIYQTAQVSKAVKPEASSMTCMTPNMLEFDNFIKGCDYYDIAEEMDLIGITLYKNSDGGDYYTTDLLVNTAESAAVLADKHLWLIEQDANVDIPIEHFNRQTYMAVGSGVKGFAWYQWRGDYPYEGAPEPNEFGLIYNDRTPTKNFEDKIAMVKLLNELSDYSVNAEKVRSNVAILYSLHGVMYADAVDNVHEKTINKLKNTYNSRVRMFYRDLKKLDITPDILKAEHLKENKTNVKLLLVPEFDYLSKEEQKIIREFQANGGKVFIKSYDKWQRGLEKHGFSELGTSQERYDSCFELEEVLEYCGIEPEYKLISASSVGINAVKGDGYYLMSLVNISKLHSNISNVKVAFKNNITSAKLYTPRGNETVKIEDNSIIIPNIEDGVFVIIEF